jgi:hypothetical protein
MTPDEDPCRGVMSLATIHRNQESFAFLAKVWAFVAFLGELALTE